MAVAGSWAQAPPPVTWSDPAAQPPTSYQPVPQPYGAPPPPIRYGGDAARPGGGALEALVTGDWPGAARTAALAVLAMLVVSVAGMLLVANGELGSGDTVALVFAGVCLAVGGDAFANAGTDVFESGGASVDIGVLPLTVTLAGMLVLGSSFGRRLRRRGVTGGRDAVFALVRTALVLSLLFVPLALLSSRSPDPFADEGLGEVLDIGGRLGVGVWSSTSGALLFAVAATGLVLLFRRSTPALVRFRARVFPALVGALVVFAAGVVAAVVFVVWALVDIGDEDGVASFLGACLLAFVNGVLAAVLWAAGVPLTGEGGLTAEVVGTRSGSSSISLLTFTDLSGWFWLAPVVLLLVVLPVAVVVVLRQHTVVEARLEGLRFAVALAVVALGAALLLRIAVDSTVGGGVFGATAAATATFNPFLAAFVLALWGGGTGLLAPAIAAALPPGLVGAVRRRYGMAPPPRSGPAVPPPPPMEG
jgi:hypothetical protein